MSDDRCTICGMKEYVHSTSGGHAYLRHTLANDSRCGNCGHSGKAHYLGLGDHCSECKDCPCFRLHDETDEFPYDLDLERLPRKEVMRVRNDALDRSKIGSLCGQLDFQLDSIGFELDRSNLQGVRTYLKESLATLAAIVKTNKGE